MSKNELWLSSFIVTLYGSGLPTIVRNFPDLNDIKPTKNYIESQTVNTKVVVVSKRRVRKLLFSCTIESSRGLFACIC